MGIVDPLRRFNQDLLLTVPGADATRVEGSPRLLCFTSSGRPRRESAASPTFLPTTRIAVVLVDRVGEFVVELWWLCLCLWRSWSIPYCSAQQERRVADVRLDGGPDDAQRQ